MEVSGAGAFAESREVKALALLLRALSDPQDSVSLVGVLRGPLFGVSDRELFAFKQAGGWFSIFCEAGQSSSADGKAAPVASALASLRQYHRWTRVLPPPAAVERMLEHTGYLALATTTPGWRRGRRPGARRRPRAPGDGDAAPASRKRPRRSRPTPKPPATSSRSRSSLAGRPSSAS